jgi:hypothetical protein
VQRIYRHMPNSYQWFERLALGTLVPVLVANPITRPLQRAQLREMMCERPPAAFGGSPLTEGENKLISPS